MVPGEGPASIQCSTSCAVRATLALKLFRGVPVRSYPHLIPSLCSGIRFGPPPRFTGASAWTQIDHLASGLPHATLALFRLGFPPAPGLLSLNLAAYGNSQAHSTKGTPSPQRALTAYRSSPPGVLFTFPSRYYALSVAATYLALEGGPPCFRQDSSCPDVLRYGAKRVTCISATGISPSLSDLPRSFAYTCSRTGCPGAALQPHKDRSLWFGLFPFRSPLLSPFARRYSGNLV